MATLHYPMSQVRRISPHRIIYRPYIGVKITNPSSNKSWNCQALIDTGADRCIFHSWVADKLGHVLETGHGTSITDIREHETPAWIHSNILHFRDPEGIEVHYQTGVVFSPHVTREFGVLGTRGFLDPFKLNLDHSRHLIVLAEHRPR